MIPLGVMASGHNSPSGQTPAFFVDTRSSAADSATYTFAAITVGEVGRDVVFVVGTTKNGQPASLVSLTFGGVAATIDHQLSSTAGTIAIARVPSAPVSGNIEVTWNGKGARTILGAWSLPPVMLADVKSGVGSIPYSILLASQPGDIIVAGYNAAYPAAYSLSDPLSISYGPQVETWTHGGGYGTAIAANTYVTVNSITWANQGVGLLAAAYRPA